MNEAARTVALITADLRRYHRFLALGFTATQARALTKAGYDLIGYVATTPLPLSALTGVQG